MNTHIALLRDANIAARLQLSKVMVKRHGIRIAGASEGEQKDNSVFGLAFFYAYDPVYNCFRCVPDSNRFFNTAIRGGLISREDAKSLSIALVKLASQISKTYRGSFSHYFNNPEFRRIPLNLSQLEDFEQSGLASVDEWVDKLYETCPMPLPKGYRLQTRLFKRIELQEEMEFYGRSPWLSWVEALDLVCFGPWIGLRPQAILKIVNALSSGEGRVSLFQLGVESNLLGYKVTLPVYSRGLQGLVTGFFVDLPKGDLDPIANTLDQFGGTLGDLYANLRWTAFVDNLKSDLSDEQIARTVVKIVSPVNRVIVKQGENTVGLKMLDEGEYWAGYSLLSAQELKQPPSDLGYWLDGPRSTRIYIEPLDMPELNPELLRLRMESNLNVALKSVIRHEEPPELSFKKIEDLYNEYRGFRTTDKTSQAKLRGFHVVEKVRKNWDQGKVNIENAELKRFMEQELGKSLNTGYQITSYVSDIEKLFESKILIVKLKNALALSWSKGA